MQRAFWFWFALAASSHRSYPKFCFRSPEVIQGCLSVLCLRCVNPSPKSNLRSSVCQPSTRLSDVRPSTVSMSAAHLSVCPTTCPLTICPSVLEFSSLSLSTITLLEGTLPLPYHVCACSLCAAAPVSTAG